MLWDLMIPGILENVLKPSLGKARQILFMIQIRKLSENPLKGTSNNSILFSNLGFFPATAFPKYSFSDAILRFWRLVPEKNTCVGVPKGMNRVALK